VADKLVWCPENPRDLHPKTIDPCPIAGVFESKAKTSQEFVEELKELQVIDCTSYGRGAQWMRTIYQPLGCVFIYEDEYMPWNPFQKSSVHWWTGDYMSQKKADQAEKRFDCYVVGAPYPDEDSKDDRMLHFNTFESCANWVWAYRRTDLYANIYPYLVLTYTNEELTGVFREFSKYDDVHLDCHNDERVYDMLGRALGSNQGLCHLEDATEKMLDLAKKLAEEE